MFGISMFIRHLMFRITHVHINIICKYKTHIAYSVDRPLPTLSPSHPHIHLYPKAIGNYTNSAHIIIHSIVSLL